MRNVVSRLRQALTFKTDFRLKIWVADRAEARKLLAVATAADLGVQAVFGDPGWLSVLASIALPFIFWSVPARLGAGVGLVMATQAIGSAVVILLASLVGLPRFLVEGGGVVWQVYCMSALVMLTLQYIRTPKTQMP